MRQTRSFSCGKLPPKELLKFQRSRGETREKKPRDESTMPP
jgi:hypothetical protein